MALIDDDPVNRCIAAVDVPRIKAQQIYKGAAWAQFEQYQSCGKKLIAYDCVEFARGIRGASSTLAKVILPAKSRSELRERLLVAFL